MTADGDSTLLAAIREVVPEHLQYDDENTCDAHLLGRVHALLYPEAQTVNCRHCGQELSGYGMLADGQRVCHVSGGGPDCYRRVTVYGEPVGALIGVAELPEGISACRR